ATMVFTHLPSNLLLAGIAFAPTLPVAVGLLLARSVLSQMDVPTRQAYVMALVEPSERTAAAGYTNTARYVVRPLGPVLAGAGQGVFLGLPFVVAGSVKAAYDLILWRWFRGVALPDGDRLTASDVHRAVDYRPITRYEVVAGYTNLPGLAAVPDQYPTTTKETDT